MSWITDILQGFPTNDVLRQRLELFSERHEFEILKSKTGFENTIAQLVNRAEKSEAERDVWKHKYENEKNDHAVTKNELESARTALQLCIDKNRPRGPIIRSPL